MKPDWRTVQQYVTHHSELRLPVDNTDRISYKRISWDQFPKNPSGHTMWVTKPRWHRLWITAVTETGRQALETSLTLGFALLQCPTINTHTESCLYNQQWPAAWVPSVQDTELIGHSVLLLSPVKCHQATPALSGRSVSHVRFTLNNKATVWLPRCLRTSNTLQTEVNACWTMALLM